MVICDVSLLCMEQLLSMIPASTVEDIDCSSEIPNRKDAFILYTKINTKCLLTQTSFIFKLQYPLFFTKAIISILFVSHPHVQQKQRRAGGDY